MPMIYAQFSNATKLNSLVNGLLPYLTIDPMEFYTEYFNITTCNGDGLDNYGRILGVSRAVPNLNPAFFGWGTLAPAPLPLPTPPIYPQNWNNGTWTTLQQINDSSNGYTNLTDDIYRQVLLMAYKVYNCNYSIIALNKIINGFVKYFNSSYSVIVRNTANVVMQIDYVFNFPVPAWVQNIISLKSILPTPLGVVCNVIYS